MDAVDGCPVPMQASYTVLLELLNTACADVDTYLNCAIDCDIGGQENACRLTDIILF